jgi:hypothetical protein
MLRVLDEAEPMPDAGLACDLKTKFDEYLSSPTARTQAILAELKQTGRHMPLETFDSLRVEVMSKYHTEIDLYQARAEARQRRTARIPNYSTLPVTRRIYIDDIDSFWKVRQVSAESIAHLLTNGYLERSEDTIQRAFEKILIVPLHKIDWAGELNDLYTANLVVNGGWRVATAFLLKGKGLRRRELQISDCGKNGDQIVRLVDSPAELFIVQFVGNISEAVIKDLDGKILSLHAQGKAARYCIIDGQDTARLLKAYDS